ncbi:MAG: hypothetical protein INF84_17625 [Roseomonas sp.]|nr:hypothetical protein [Roseomonas sp.]
MQTNRRVAQADSAFTCVALLETSTGAELHMRDARGKLLRLPLRDGDALSHLATLAAFNGPGRPNRARLRSH